MKQASCAKAVFDFTFKKPWLFPTGPFSISKPQSQQIGEFYVVQGRHATDFESPICERVGRVALSKLMDLII